jgi:hypothetical protein
MIGVECKLCHQYYVKKVGPELDLNICTTCKKVFIASVKRDHDDFMEGLRSRKDFQEYQQKEFGNGN